LFWPAAQESEIQDWEAQFSQVENISALFWANGRIAPSCSARRDYLGSSIQLFSSTRPMVDPLRAGISAGRAGRRRNFSSVSGFLPAEGSGKIRCAQ
jgi:hypothetical protein